MANLEKHDENKERGTGGPAMSRRATITSVAAYLGAVTAGAVTSEASLSSPDHKGSTGIAIKSPKNGVIVDVIDAKGRPVSVGTLICHIEPDDENRAIERIKLSEKLIALEAQLLSDEQIKARRRLVEIATEITAKYVEYAQFKYDNEKTQQALGLVTDVALKQSETALAKAKGEREKAGIALAAFDFNVQMMKARHDLIESQIPAEIDFLTHKMARLEVHAPRDGKITFLVGPGSFVKMGQPIAEIV